MVSDILQVGLPPMAFIMSSGMLRCTGPAVGPKAILIAASSFVSSCAGWDTKVLYLVQCSSMPTVFMAVQELSCDPLLPWYSRAVWAVMTSMGTLLAYALAMPVIRLVVPGPVVAQQTPILPLSLA